MGYDEPWGDEVGEGWNTIVLECHRQLKHLDSEYKIFQIKEKFGGLRYYFESTFTDNEITYEIMCYAVEEAEARCARTCEVCGADGILRINNGWYKTLCDEHTSERV